MSQQNIYKYAIQTYDIANSHETLHLARFIRENNLFRNIHGKEYVNAEGWQYVGVRLGILPVIEALADLSTKNEIKYRASVRLVNLKDQHTAGSGYAVCISRENGKRGYQEFTIASMAQTRAIGKGYWHILAWIIRAAGYEPTPAEEMDYMSRVESSKTRSYDQTRESENLAKKITKQKILQV